MYSIDGLFVRELNLEVKEYKKTIHACYFISAAFCCTIFGQHVPALNFFWKK